MMDVPVAYSVDSLMEENNDTRTKRVQNTIFAKRPDQILETLELSRFNRCCNHRSP